MKRYGVLTILLAALLSAAIGASVVGQAAEIGLAPAAEQRVAPSARDPQAPKKRTPTPTATPKPTLTPTATPTSTPTATPTPGDAAVAYQVDTAHTGATSQTSLALPLSEKWRVDLGGPVSYPLIAQGKVFVTVGNTSGYGTRLFALDAATGSLAWGPVPIDGTYYWSGAAYDAGAVFVVNFDGVLRSFDAATGSLRWSQRLPGQYAFSSPPVATQGAVYVSGAGTGGTLYAVDEATGEVRWTASVVNGDHSSPALSPGGLFVSYSCPNVYRFDPATGALIWRYSTGCSGGGGKTSVYYQGRLYVRDLSGSIFDGERPTIVGSFPNGTAPAFRGALGYVRSGTALVAFDAGTGSVAWSFAGDGALASAPLVAGEHVYVGSTAGKLYAVDAATGREAWSANVGVGIRAPDEQNVSQPLTGLNAGEGILAVPAGSVLVVYSGH